MMIGLVALLIGILLLVGYVAWGVRSACSLGDREE